MIHLHERLSEFSYGYGITREAESLLGSIGLRGAPFLPSLAHEGSIGYDVKLGGPGKAIILQFKLGQQLQRFHRRSPLYLKPPIQRPFWRFEINTWQPAGQYQLLLNAEQSTPEVYYVAPRFHDWNVYAAAYDAQQLLTKSLLIKPSEIMAKLTIQKAAPGRHLVVYDHQTSYVCSQPIQLSELRPDDLASDWAKEPTKDAARSLSEQIGMLLEGLDRTDAMASEALLAPKSERGDYDEADFITERETARIRRAGRSSRIKLLRERGQSREQAEAIAVGFELWARGAQLILAGEALADDARGDSGSTSNTPDVS